MMQNVYFGWTISKSFLKAQTSHEDSFSTDEVIKYIIIMQQLTPQLK